MSRPEDIPQDVWDAADAAFEIGAAGGVFAQEIIARAIMAAKAEEREACAELAELVGIPMAANCAQVLMIPVKIADRIRKRGEA